MIQPEDLKMMWQSGRNRYSYIVSIDSNLLQVGETCASGITFINQNAPEALVGGNGRLIMGLATIVCGMFVFAKSYRSLEILGDFGFSTILVMVIVIMVSF